MGHNLLSKRQTVHVIEGTIALSYLYIKHNQKRRTVLASNTFHCNDSILQPDKVEHYTTLFSFTLPFLPPLLLAASPTLLVLVPPPAVSLRIHIRHGDVLI